jgi:hypothetical protein
MRLKIYKYKIKFGKSDILGVLWIQIIQHKYLYIETEKF